MFHAVCTGARCSPWGSGKRKAECGEVMNEITFGAGGDRGVSKTIRLTCTELPPISFPVAVSQTFNVLSKLPVTMCLPSGV